MTVRIRYEASRAVAEPQLAVDIHRGDGIYCFGTNTRIDRLTVGTIDGAGHVDLVIPRLWLLPGCYSLSVGIHDTDAVRTHDVRFHAYPFVVTSDRRDLGVTYLEHRWELPVAHPTLLRKVAGR
jgi:hypothetical protein